MPTVSVSPGHTQMPGNSQGMYLLIFYCILLHVYYIVPHPQSASPQTNIHCMPIGKYIIYGIFIKRITLQSLILCFTAQQVGFNLPGSWAVLRLFWIKYMCMHYKRWSKFPTYSVGYYFIHMHGCIMVCIL